MTTALVHEPVTKPPLTACHPGELVRVYVWQWPVRMTHWATAYAILFLAATGLYMGHPLITVGGPAGQHFVMGWARTIHSYSAIVFALSVVSRVLWMFMGNNYATWDKFIPVGRRRRRGLWDSLRYYLFQLRQPPGFVGHNPLAGFSYTFVFLLYFVMITTGLALYNVNAPVGSPFWAFHFLLPLWGGAQTARFVHHVATDRLGSPGARARGRALFVAYCVLCHGERGDGRGPRTAGFAKPPANFTDSAWRRGATPRRVFFAIREGVRGTPMPSWKWLSESETWDLVAYVLSFGSTPA